MLDLSIQSPEAHDVMDAKIFNFTMCSKVYVVGDLEYLLDERED